MSSPSDFPARGKIIEVRDSVAIFQPSGTNYQFQLEFTGDVKPEVSAGPIDVLIKVEARKVYTVPSGGNFVQPIFGTPRIIQGRVKFADNKTIVVQAGVPIIVTLPSEETAIDLSEGKIQVGHMANVVAKPGAAMQLLTATAAAG